MCFETHEKQIETRFKLFQYLSSERLKFFSNLNRMASKLSSFRKWQKVQSLASPVAMSRVKEN
jgi:hypothetical protein